MALLLETRKFFHLHLFVILVYFWIVIRLWLVISYKTSASAFYYLYNVRRIRKYLSVKVTESLVHALVTSRIDHCNSLLFGLPDCQLNKLRRVLNAAARLIYMAPKFCHITPILMELHWLPVRWRIDYYKILLITFKAINGLAPLYLSDLFNNYSMNVRWI